MSRLFRAGLAAIRGNRVPVMNVRRVGVIQPGTRAKRITSYAEMTIREAEKRLGVRFSELRAVPVDAALEGKIIDKEMVDAIKETVYSRIIEYLDIEGYPTEANPFFKEANISDLVLYTIGPILNSVRKMGRNIRLTREKELASADGETGGKEEFVVLDYITVTGEKFMLIIEAKLASMGQAMKQILLSLKDARDNNKGGTFYDFVTTGEHWRMLSYDGTEFVMTNQFTVVFDTMGEEKEGWMMKNSVVVDCVYLALSHWCLLQAIDYNKG